MADALVDVQGMGCRLGPRSTVTGVTFALCPGDVVGLVGANGGGKTTTLKMLAGLVRADAGSGRILGHDVRAPSRRHRDIGYMPQANALYPELTVRENLRFRCDVFGLAPRSTIAEATAAFGLDRVLDQRVDRLSGGWGRRVQFAATMLHRPRLLLLDEPTVGLDARTVRLLWGWIGACAAQGCGVVISTHDLTEARRFGRVIYYQDGTAWPICDPRSLMARAGETTLEGAIVTLSGEP